MNDKMRQYTNPFEETKANANEFNRGKRKLIILLSITLSLCIAMGCIYIYNYNPLLYSTKDSSQLPTTINNEEAEPSTSKEETIEESSKTNKEESGIKPIKEGDFRYATWGMTKAEVKNCETEVELTEENLEGLLFCDYVLFSYPVDILYVFDMGRGLYGGSYSFRQKHSEYMLYYKDYQIIVNEYIEKYGEPSEEIIDWINPLFQDNQQDWGKAVAAGHVRFATIWVIDNTRISIILNGDNFEIGLTVLYNNIYFTPYKNNKAI